MLHVKHIAIVRLKKRDRSSFEPTVFPYISVQIAHEDHFFSFFQHYFITKYIFKESNGLNIRMGLVFRNVRASRSLASSRKAFGQV